MARARMKAICLVPLAVFFATGASAASPPTPATLRADIEHRSAKAVVDHLWNSHAWDLVVDHISRGEEAWIALAPSLAAGTDAGASETLSVSLADALPRNPEAVLAVLDLTDGPVLGPGQVCSAPFYDDSKAASARYRRRALQAVKAIRDPRLNAARDACLTRLKAG